MARVNVTWGEPRRTIVYPAAAEELSKLAGAVLSGAGNFAGGMRQDHLFGMELGATGAFAGGPLVTAIFNLDAALEATGGLVPGLSQSHLAGVALSGDGALAPGLQQDHQFAGALSADAEIGAGVIQLNDMALALSAASDFAGAVSVSNDLAAALDTTGDLAPNMQQDQSFGAAFSAQFFMFGDVGILFTIGAVMDGTGDLAGTLVADANDLAVSIGATGDLAGHVTGEAVADPAFRCVGIPYTGNGETANAITGVGFRPDLVITIQRASTTSNQARVVNDRIALGPGKAWVPGGDGTFGNFTITFSLLGQEGITSFDGDGFTLGSTGGRMNASGVDYLALCFKPGEGAQTPNFEVQDKPNTGVNGEVFPHNVGAAPVWAFSKISDEPPAEWVDPWTLGGEAANSFGAAKQSDSFSVQAVSASDITLGDGTQWNNTGDASSPFYLFGGEEAPGLYKTGTYTGTGGSGNAITGLGFQPALVIVRSLDGTGISVLHGDLSPLTAFNIFTGTRDAAFTLDADGFTVNGSGAINRSGESFRYFAWV